MKLYTLYNSLSQDCSCLFCTCWGLPSWTIFTSVENKEAFTLLIRKSTVAWGIYYDLIVENFDGSCFVVKVEKKQTNMG